jgi:hypothetical protein
MVKHQILWTEDLIIQICYGLKQMFFIKKKLKYANSSVFEF